MRSVDVRLAVVAMLLSACAPATQRAYIAPSNETVTSDTEVRQDDPPTHVIVVRNHSTVPITVFSVSLRGCDNVKQTCEPKAVNLRIPGGGHAVAMRVQPENPHRGFTYSFGFSWRADSGATAALVALAGAGDTTAGKQLRSVLRAQAADRANGGTRYNELTRDDFRALKGRVAAMRAEPDTLVMAPGQRVTIDQVRVILVDSAGKVVGRTRWVQWTVPSTRQIQFTPPDRLMARAPGRGMLRFRLADEALSLLDTDLEELDVPVVARYAMTADAPTFMGRLLDAETKTRVACARVALEDSAQNVVARDRADAAGMFVMRAPHPGTYRVRVDAYGWAPVRGPDEMAQPGEERQREYLVRFTEQVMVSPFEIDPTEYDRARPAAVSMMPTPRAPGRSAEVPVIQGVTLGGSDAMPVLGIITRVTPGTTWMQFVVDSAGRADTASVTVPPGVPAAQRASIVAVLPRVRFTAARDHGRPVCDLMRMQVNFTPR